ISSEACILIGADDLDGHIRGRKDHHLQTERHEKMARLTNVPNSKLCKGVKKTLIETYVGFVPTFATKYANKTTITIPSGAAKWQGHVAEGNTRLDLQGADNGYGNIQAQFGKGHESCAKGGSYGGVLIVCDTPFSIADVQAALRQSLESGGLNLVR